MNPRCKCGRAAHLKGIGATGVKYYRTNCSKCRKTAQKAKQDYCRDCGVAPEDKRLLDVDHIDGDRSNNASSNLQTLCKPCHRNKTKENRDYKNEKLHKMQYDKASN